MRIAYLVNQYPKVSHTFIRREIAALEQQGHEVLRLSIRGWDLELVDPHDQSERHLTKYALSAGFLDILTHFLRAAVQRPLTMFRAIILTLRMGWQSDRGLVRYFAYLAEACRILPWMKEANICHLHAHFGTNSADVAMLAHELGGPPWSFTAHGPEEFDRAPGINLTQKVLRSKFVVAISSFGRSQLCRTVDHQTWSKISVVHCGVDAAFMQPLSQQKQTSRRLVCVGRLCENKAQLLLLEATKRLRDSGVDFEIVLAGDGETRPEIEDFIRLNKLDGMVRITGWISGEAVRDEILSSRALVLPSFAEGLPVVIMEAMACGRPVISTFIAGIPELVRDRKDGWLVPAGDLDALVEAMIACLQAPDTTIFEMGTSAHTRVVERHNIEKEAAKLASLFEGYAVSE